MTWTFPPYGVESTAVWASGHPSGRFSESLGDATHKPLIQLLVGVPEGRTNPDDFGKHAAAFTL
jgi:hypothetical protein